MISEVIDKLFSDDDGDNTSEEDNKRVFEDNVLEYSADDLDKDFQVNFDAPEMQLILLINCLKFRIIFYYFYLFLHQKLIKLRNKNYISSIIHKIIF